jgi:GT2 family glycosyltransferase/glycosyltransferase involved in cell wall biosynthesis
MDISIVVPIYNALELSKQCLASVFEHGAQHRFEVIFVDNGSAPDVEAWLVAEEQVHANLKHQRYPAPLGFAKSVNAGVAAAIGEVVIVLNSDTIVSPGWMDELYTALVTDPSLGALTPCTNHAGDQAQMDFATIDLPPAKALALMAKRNAEPNILYVPQRLTFFCVALRRAVWLEFNGLDEAYKVGNFEDDDLCLRLRVAGYRLGVAQHVFVYHHNNATFNSNQIKHGAWMTQNTIVFADHARKAAGATPPVTPRWPKRSMPEISVVILPREGAKPGEGLERTLRSLDNQTILNFEIVLPTDKNGPTRLWVAYVTEGDILYPFHLEALWDAMDRSGSDSIFADGWVAGAEAADPHPDTSKLVRIGPRMLPGWMHHASLDRDHLWEQSVPQHWPRLTWEMQQAPNLPAHPVVKQELTLIDRARKAYRKALPLSTRLKLDAKVRQIIGRPAQDPEDKRFADIAAQLRALREAGTDAGKFHVETNLPAIIQGNAVAWNSVTQRQHHFARGLARRGHPVFWLEPALSPAQKWWVGRPLPQVAPNIYLVRLPGSARDIYTMQWSAAVTAAMTEAMQQVAAAYGFKQAVSLVNYPRWQPLAASLRERCSWKVADDCLDDQHALADLYQTATCAYQDRLTESADEIFTSSVLLRERMKPRESILLHNACDFDLFSTATSMGHLTHLKKPVIGFFGALADWLDSDLIHAAALKFPEWSFVFIGPHTFSNTEIEVKWLKATDLPNVTVIPQLDPRPLAQHLADFDVAVMPFLDIPVTRSMNAVKLYEYLAAGKPAIARDLPEVRYLTAGDSAASDLIALYTTPEEYFDRLRAAVESNTPALEARRREFASRNDWSQRVDVLSKRLTELAGS